MDILLDGAGGEGQNIERRVDQGRVEHEGAVRGMLSEAPSHTAVE